MIAYVMPELSGHPIHLGLGATAVVEPPFTGHDWYEAYIGRHAADGTDGRLVSLHSFDTSWTSWEMHPSGEEVVLVTDGRMTLHQVFPDGRRETISLQAGDYAINPRGVWHTADVTGNATALFITPGLGTEHRPR